MVCVLPVGSYEQHGPHLPPTVDVEIAQYISKKVAEEVGGVVLPPVVYTCSREHSGFKNTISVSCRVFIQYLEEVVTSAVEKCGVLIIVIGHGGVVDAVKVVEHEVNNQRGPRAYSINIWSYLKARDHAGTDETNIYLATGGRLVGEVAEICEGDVSLFGKAPVHYFSKSGVVGCLKPSEIDIEKGYEKLSKALEKILEDVKKFLTIHYTFSKRL
ncbi:MAG: creatininase family protein [Pyrobaculum sp.]|jgi:creatinine amidohydrolase